jgi:hypothetical protein
MGREDMNDLDQAIETITEGGQALGVSCEDVYRAMLMDDKAMVALFGHIHSEHPRVTHAFTLCFDVVAAYLLEEAQRANLELEAGL